MTAQVIAKDEISVRDLVRKLKAATETMSVTNGHRILLLHAMSALMQLATRLEAGESAPAETTEEITQ